MSMKNYCIIVVLLIGTLVATVAKAQNEIKEISYAAYLKSSVTLWEKAVEIEKKKVASNPTNTNKFDLAMAYYGLLSATMATKDEDSFDKYLSTTKTLLAEIIDEDESLGEPQAVLSSVMGLEMAYSPMKGMYLGYKSSSNMDDAVEFAPDSPLVIKLFAGSKLYTPSMFGGDTEEAQESFIKAIEKFEEKPENIQSNWLYLDALAHLGISYQKNGDSENAEKIYRKAIELEPDFFWVSKSLLPSLLASK